MSTIHRFIGEWGTRNEWDGARSRAYSQGAQGATETWLIGKAELAENFAMRYYELEPGGHSHEEHHPYDHGVIFLRGSGEVTVGAEVHAVGLGDVVYISPDEVHQIRNTGGEPLGWLCIIPARRQKQGRIVWAEEGLDDLKTTHGA
jgi:quercetin dioxygenase-like cupin family protein